ncbi:succinate dehydrogenase, hydrophobic membrane anchor protein [Burkholderia pseudomallei]|nr:succinate dehydrogenase, hydrophobic membrane anchor protein [Burkholderia pseudomallei]
MAANNRIGSKRLVVGAHYGLRDWLAFFNDTATTEIYTVILLVWFFIARDFSYEGWASIFATQWMKLATFVTLLSLFYHAWVGVRDIWMDYIKPVGVRLLLQSLTIVWLLACAGYAAQILWRV